jgi:hypothetical protein
MVDLLGLMVLLRMPQSPVNRVKQFIRIEGFSKISKRLIRRSFCPCNPVGSMRRNKDDRHFAIAGYELV